MMTEKQIQFAFKSGVIDKQRRDQLLANLKGEDAPETLPPMSKKPERAKSTERVKRLQKRRKEAGLCPTCGQPRNPSQKPGS